MPYKPLPYGSREYIALKQTVKHYKSRATIGKRVVLVEREVAAGPGLWTRESAEMWVVSIKAPPIPGLSNNVTETIGSGFTRDEALTKAAERLADKK